MSASKDWKYSTLWQEMHHRKGIEIYVNHVSPFMIPSSIHTPPVSFNSKTSVFCNSSMWNIISCKKQAFKEICVPFQKTFTSLEQEKVPHILLKWSKKITLRVWKSMNLGTLGCAWHCKFFSCPILETNKCKIIMQKLRKLYMEH